MIRSHMPPVGMAEPWLLNLLLYKPGHNGFSRYVQRVVPQLPGRRLWLLDDRDRLDLSADGLPRALRAPAPLALLQNLTLAQHGTRVRRRLARRGWVDAPVVYSPYPDYLFALADRPQIVTCHDLTPLYWPSSRRAQWRYRLWTPLHLQRAERIVAISQFVADQLIDLGLPAQRLVVIPNGIASAPTPVRAPRSHDWLILARHDRNKNLGQALQAFAGFLQHRPEWPGVLRIVGRSGRTTPRLLRLLQELGLGDRVQLVPALSEADLTQQLRNTFALLSPSLMEGFDYPVLEAKAQGIPTLISEIPVHRELYGSSSLFFPAGAEPSDLTQSMCRLVDEPQLWSELSRAGLACAAGLSLGRQVAAIRAEITALAG